MERPNVFGGNRDDRFDAGTGRTSPPLHRIVIDHFWSRDTLCPMATEIREQMEMRFQKAYDEYIAGKPLNQLSKLNRPTSIRNLTARLRS